MCYFYINLSLITANHLINLSIKFETFLKHGGRLQTVMIAISQII